MGERFRYSGTEEVEADLAAAPRPTAYELQDGYPFSMLTDRQFECLLHDIMSTQAGRSDSRFGDFDRAVLMQGVGERGRDCALVKDARHVGVVQCKRYESLITKPDAAREIIKFCLNAQLDSSLIPDPKGFKYIFAASKDFNDRAKTLLHAFPDSIAKEKDLLDWIAEVVSEYKAFSTIDPKAVQNDLLEVLQSIEIVPLGFNELNTLLVGQVKILERYFSVRKVVDNERVDFIGEQVEKIARTLADADVRHLLDDLNSVPADRRLDLGIISLWGYPSAFLKHLFQQGRFKEVGMTLAMAKGQFDQLFTDYLTERVNSEILAQITARRQFAPIAISAAPPYLVGRILERWRLNQQGTVLSDIVPRPNIQTDAVSIRAHVLKMGGAYLQGDWSGYYGEGELLALKKRLVSHTYGAFHTTDEMAQAFDRDWIAMTPILEQIERRIEQEIPEYTTIILGGLRWFDDEDRVRTILKTAKNFEPKTVT